MNYILVMGRTPFYRTSDELEHHFSNIKQTGMCSIIGEAVSSNENQDKTSKIGEKSGAYKKHQANV